VPRQRRAAAGMRVIALLLVTLLIVVSDFWLARGRAVDAQAELTGATQVAAEAGEPGDAAPGEEPAAAGGDALPDGFAPVEPLTDEPRRAFEAAGEALVPGLDYVPLLRTSKGDIVVALYGAPPTLRRARSRPRRAATPSPPASRPSSPSPTSRGARSRPRARPSSPASTTSRSSAPARATSSSTCTRTRRPSPSTTSCSSR